MDELEHTKKQLIKQTLGKSWQKTDMLKYFVYIYLILNCRGLLSSPAELILQFFSINNLHTMPDHSYFKEITSHFRNNSKQSWKMLRSSFKHMHWPREWDKYIKINVSLNRKIFLSGSILLRNKTVWCLNDF